jgi:hypothetical protein
VWGPSLDNYIETLVFYIVLNLYAIRPKTRKTRGLAQHGRGGEWPCRLFLIDLLCDGRSVPSFLTDHTTCPGWQELLSCEFLAIPAAAIR